MTQKVSILFFNLDDSMALVSDLKSHYQADKNYESMSVSGAGELSQYLMVSSNGIVFFKVMTREDLQLGVEFLKAHKKLIKRGLLKPVCILGVRSKKVEIILSKHGCVDTLDPILKAKTVAYKVDMWSTPILNHLGDIERQDALKKKHKEAVLAKKAAKMGTKVEKSDFEFRTALAIESDFWILKDKGECKKVLNKYLIRLLGPSPAAVEWVELAKKPTDKFTTWKYVEKTDSPFKFLNEDGTWFFTGSKPEFDWKINRWVFSGQIAHLFFYYKDGRNHSRFNFNNKSAIICENSQFAFNQEASVSETFDPKYNIESEKEHKAADESIEKEQEDLKDLEGKAKTDNIENNPLEGEGKTDDVSTDPLSGKNSTDNLSSDPLSGKAKTDQTGTDPLSADASNYNLSSDPLSHEKEKASSGKELEAPFNPHELDEKRADHHSSTETPNGELSGKGSADNVSKNPLHGNANFNPHDLDEKKNNENEKTIDLTALESFTPPEVKDSDNKDPFKRASSEESLKQENQEGEDSDFSGVLDPSLAPEKKPDDPFEGFDPDFDPFSLPKKDDDDFDFALDPSSFQTDKQKKPKKYMNLSDYLGGVEGNTTADDETKKEQPIESEHGSSIEAKTEQATEEQFKEEDIGYGTNWKSSKKRKGSQDLDQESKRDTHERSMLEALDGGLTDQEKESDLKNDVINQLEDPDLQIGKELEQEEKNIDLDAVIGGTPSVNLESGELKVVLKQRSDAGNDITFICGFEDFYEDELIVKAPKNSLAKDSEVLANVTLTYNGQKIKVASAGVIEEIEELNEHEDTLIISITKIDSEKYERFLELYQQRQGSINEFMELAKGY